MTRSRQHQLPEIVGGVLDLVELVEPIGSADEVVGDYVAAGRRGFDHRSAEGLNLEGEENKPLELPHRLSHDLDSDRTAIADVRTLRGELTGAVDIDGTT